MLYNEFIEGTGCKDNEHNYQVYKDLEVMYMNSNKSKAEIYEYGKKLVDNSKSEAELLVEEGIRLEIAGHKSQIESYKKDLQFQEWMLTIDNTKDRRDSIKYTKQAIKQERQMIKKLQWVLE